MEGRLDEARATIIKNALMNDNFAVGSDGWLEEHHITRDEYDAFLEYPARLAAMYEWRQMNMDVGSVEVELTFVKHSGKVGSDDEQWSVFAPQADTAKVLMVAQTGPVTATLTPKQMPLPMGDEVGIFDKVTGEVLDG